jgi:hypothetical protein
MDPMTSGEFAPLLDRARRLLPVILTLALFILVVTALASTYFGHSRSPYDTCYGTNGRAISCAVIEGLR